VLAYAFNPIDLIPDFIPVLGLLDAAILVPLGINLALRLIAPEVMADAQQRATEMDQQDRPTSVIGAVVIVLLWLIATGLAGRFFWLKSQA